MLEATNKLMEKYTVTGMSCAACVARVEKAVNKVAGVSSCSVSLLTNSMGVEGNADAAEIIKAVENAGYGASLQGTDTGSTSSTETLTSLENKSLSPDTEVDSLKDRESPILIKRLILSTGFLLLLMYISMGHTMWGWPLPSWFNGNHLAMGLLQMILAAIIMLINKKFFISGFKSVIHGAPNMDTLVAMGSGVSFLYSLVMLFGMTASVTDGDNERTMHFMHNLYFEGAAMIVTLITVGKLLESLSKGRTTDALKGLMKLAPKTAVILENRIEKEVSVSQLHIDDIFIVRPGQNIPADGIIIEGNTAINEAALTGESVPVDKQAGDFVSAATINTSGFIKCRATRVGEDTTLSQIIKMVSDAAATKAPIARIADKVAGVFVPSVIAIAAVTFAVWLILGAEFSFALSRSIAVLVVSCPCALGLATPVAIMVGNGKGARNGILFKTSAALEAAGRTNIVVLDKTGTITKGEPLVTDLLPSADFSEVELLEYAASLEAGSEHPLAKAVMKEAEKRGLSLRNISDFKAMAGSGVRGKDGTAELFGGSLKFAQGITSIDNGFLQHAEEYSDQGKTPLFFIKKYNNESKVIGIIAVADVIKEDSAAAISELKKMGIKTIMLTGDNERTAKAVGEAAGVNQIIAGLMPDEKAAVITKLKKEGKVMMVGDGINDAPALTSADTGTAIGAGTDVAIDAADIVLVKSRLSDIPSALKLSRATLRNIHENLFWAFFYNVLLIPLAAGVYHKLGLDMNPMFGAAAMSLSSFCVVSNALRLNLFKMNNTNTKAILEEKKMTERTIKVNGMMCEHCEMHVKKALEAIDGIDAASADHKKGEVKLTLSKAVADDAMKAAVTDAGYEFVG